MIIVRVELWSAVTGEKTELARMEICNDGTSAGRLRNYIVRTLRGRSTEALNQRTTQRDGRVDRHDAPGLHVWNLVAKALGAMGYGDRREEPAPDLFQRPPAVRKEPL
jgi:hypothetical protein